ncbi:glycosyltransferase [Paraclostridium ghonii]|uniref:glycosyltransferase n=1 Tax=Paraclostridium ghonii TaxID=29358 RepID=UPI0035242508
MRLSIVMMVKNEQKYLNNTLSSLEPLMKAINSELIILDTGSTDETVSIAKKYTNKIYYKKWNDNFGDMRNTSISYSNGDWVLILDADEQLVEYEKIVGFFNTNLHENYNCASIELKNFTSEDEELYSRASIPRLFKKDNNFRYQGAIHEQPIYKEPIYNNIAIFNHYGYIFTDEEVKQSKVKRNEKILLTELKLRPKDPYINYQLAQNYMADGDEEEALTYMERAYFIYENLKLRYIPCESGLAKLYCQLSKYEKCEHVCKKYMKYDKNNIDIYCYLALSQKALKKYDESFKNYKRYLYLIENYDISTQSNSIFAICDTFAFKENAKLDIIDILFEQEKYELVLKHCETLKQDQLKQAQYYIFKSLYNLDKFSEIIDMYNDISNSLVDRDTFLSNLERFILNIKQSDRNKIYMILSNINGNYGILNSIRLGMKLSDKEYNEILLKEDEIYYSDIIYYALKNGSDLVDLLEGVKYLNVDRYFEYLVLYRKNCILELYNYLVKASNTMDLNKIIIYQCLSKHLLFNGGLKDKKYEQLLYMYLAYSCVYIKQIYNELLTDEDLLRLAKDEDDTVLIRINLIEKIKKDNPLNYVKQMRELLVNNKKYKNPISLLIDKFKVELEESEELKTLKKQYKKIIENDINKGDIKNAQIKIDEYQSLFEFEAEILNLKAITKIASSEFIEADNILKKAHIIDRNNYDIIFNISFVKEMLGEFNESVKYLNYIIKYCGDESIIYEAKEKLTEIIQYESKSKW